MTRHSRPGAALRAGLLGSAAVMLLAPAAEAAKTPVYAITKAKVVTVSGAIIENATVVLRDGVLVDVGSSVVIPKDARVIDGTGMTVTPGLIDAYSGAGMPAVQAAGGGRGAAAAAPTPAIPPPNPNMPAGSIYERVRVVDALRARDSGITTIVPVPRDGLVFGAAAVMDLVGEKAEGMVVRPNFAFAASMATLRQTYPGSLMGTMAFFRQALIDASYHRAEVAAYDKAPSGKKRPAFDPGLEAWAAVGSGSMPLLLQTPRVGDLRRAFALADEFKLKLILAGNTQASEDMAILKERKPTLLVSVNFDPPRVGGGFGGGGGGTDDDKERADIENAEKNPATLNKEGVKFALVSGFATDFLAGVRKAIEKGLPKEVALRSITLTPAEVLGLADRMGSLEKGKIANVVVWSGEPLTREAKIKMVFVDGELYEPDEQPAGFPGGRGPRPGNDEDDKGGDAVRIEGGVK